MADDTNIDPRRIAAMEGLLHYYLADDRHSAGRDMEVSLSPENACKVSFVLAPNKAEIGALIKYLQLMTDVVPAKRDARVTLDVVNGVFNEAGLPPIRKSST